MRISTRTSEEGYADGNRPWISNMLPALSRMALPTRECCNYAPIPAVSW
jgi:hypothetical protein